MLSCVQLCNPVDLAHPAPLSMVFFRQEYWSGLPFSSPGDLPDPGMEPMCLVSTCFSRHIPYHLGSPLKVSVQFSHSVVSNSLWPHGLQHTRLPCPSPTPGACSNSHPSSQWCHPTISFSVIPFSFCLQSFPASQSFPMSWLFTSSGKIIGVSAGLPWWLRW